MNERFRKWYHWWWLGCFFLGVLQEGIAQKNTILSKKISISLVNISPELALEKISQVGKFDFAYASGVLPTDYKINYKAENESISSILTHIITDKSIEYKTLGSQVIFYRTTRPETKKPIHVLRGYIRDILTGEPIPNAEMYDAYLPISAVSNQKGRYELTVPNPDYLLRLTIQAKEYISKNLRVRIASDRTLNLAMRPKPLDLEELKRLEPKVPIRPSIENIELLKPIETTKITQVFVDKKKSKAENIETLLKNKAIQLGFIPGVGTNGIANGQNFNWLSINILAGYSAGSRGFDFSGLLNMNRFNIKGIQLAGLGNLVGGRTSGFQFSGLANVVRLQTSGMQLAGISNFSGLSMQGFQFAGITNVIRGKIKGLQISAINNMVTDGGSGIQISGVNNFMQGKISGIQLAGLSNSTVGEVSGFQLAGVFNSGFKKFSGSQISGAFNTVFGQMRGWQTAGAFNFVSRSAKGVQIAGASNLVFGKLSGIQISPINLADTVKGFQIGVINLARKYEKGIPIGLLNFTGYYGIETGAEETGMLFFKAKTGVKRLYNIVSGGLEPIQIDFWKAGYGFGTEFISKKRLQMALDYTFSYVQEAHLQPDFNFLHRLELNGYYRPLKILALFAGFSLNQYNYVSKNLAGEIVESQLTPKSSVLNKQMLKNGKTSQIWWGFQVGIRIF